MTTANQYWTHPSVIRLAAHGDPVGYITQRARELVFTAIEAGWAGPPFDPFALADHLQIRVVPREDILDARTIPLDGGGLQIEFNPNRPTARIRFSLAHEIAHTLFPDCRERVRNRLARDHMREEDWQLELLCNLAAAELLMPIGSFPDLKDGSLSIDALMELRQKYGVSTEAILLRVARLTDIACAAFCVSRQEQGADESRYRIDYAVGSTSWRHALTSGQLLPPSSVVRECTAIGFTAKGDERWSGVGDLLHIEAVGIPPYPKHRYPRVAGIARLASGEAPQGRQIAYLRGDALQPRGEGLRIICHVVNDRAPRWGGGFALAVRRRFPQVQEDFLTWANDHPDDFTLGQSRFCAVDKSLAVFSMICQQGYGPARRPRVRYAAMQSCLDALADLASKRSASVHMPRIGCGQAGGSWPVVRELIEESLCHRDVAVTVYDLPEGGAPVRPTQRGLFGE